jgi:DNA transformation protein and related proteins
MARDELVDLTLELLAPLGAVRTRRMFGGHGFYVDDLFIAIIAAGRLYLKTDGASRAAFETAGGEPFVFVAKGQPTSTSYWTVPAEAMESPASMQRWGRLAVQAAVSARKPAKTRQASTKARGAARRSGASRTR